MDVYESQSVTDFSDLGKLLDLILGRVDSVQILCRHVGVSESAYLKWRRGDSFPRAATLRRLLDLAYSPYVEIPVKGSMRPGRINKGLRSSLVERMTQVGLWPPKDRAERLSALITKSGQTPSRFASSLGVDRKTLMDLLNPLSEKVMSDVAIKNYGKLVEEYVSHEKPAKT